MTILRKTVTSVLFFSAILLTGCGGNGLINEKEVDQQAFTQQATNSVGKNTYNRAHAKGVSSVNSTAGNQSETIDQDYAYNSLAKSWIPANANTGGFEISHVLTDLTQYLSMFEQYKIVSEIHYYLADNGFRLTSNFSHNVSGDSATVKAYLIVDSIYNEFGYPTKLNADVGMEISGQGQSFKMGFSSNVEISYSTVNE